MELLLRLIGLASSIVRLAAALVDAQTQRRKLSSRMARKKIHSKTRRRVHRRRKEQEGR